MKRTREILSKVKELPPFPAVIQKVFALTTDPHVSADAIVDVVKYDQSVTAAVLRACNSAIFAGTQKITTLKEAIVRLGNRHFVHLVLSMAGSDLLRRGMPGYGLEQGGIWAHSVTVALLCDSLCEVVAYKDRDKAFTAGLLHDIGKIVLSQYVADDWAQIDETAKKGKISFVDAERAILGMDHAEAGGIIAEQWNFEPELVNAIRHHHDPALGDDSPLLFLVHLGNILVVTSGIGGGSDGLQSTVDYDLLKSRGIGPREFEAGLVRLAEVERQFHGIVSMYG